MNRKDVDNSSKRSTHNQRPQTGGVITDSYNFDKIFRENVISFSKTDPAKEVPDIADLGNKNVLALVQHKAETGNVNYKKDRYSKTVQSRNCADKPGHTAYWKNSIASKTFIDSQGKLFEDINLNTLPFTASDGDPSVKWNSFNWAIYRDTKEDKFKFGIAQLDDSSIAEIGVKHVFIAWPHDFYVGGEMRTVLNDEGAKLIQLNLNSSSNTWEDADNSKEEYMEYWACLLTYLLNAMLVQQNIRDIKVQVWRSQYASVAPSKDVFYTKGLNLADEKGGLLFYYKTNACPSLAYAETADRYSNSMQIPDEDRFWVTHGIEDKAVSKDHTYPDAGKFVFNGVKGREFQFKDSFIEVVPKPPIPSPPKPKADPKVEELPIPAKPIVLQSVVKKDEEQLSEEADQIPIPPPFNSSKSQELAPVPVKLAPLPMNLGSPKVNSVSPKVLPKENDEEIPPMPKISVSSVLKPPSIGPPPPPRSPARSPQKSPASKYAPYPDIADCEQDNVAKTDVLARTLKRDNMYEVYMVECSKDKKLKQKLKVIQDGSVNSAAQIEEMGRFNDWLIEIIMSADKISIESVDNLHRSLAATLLNKGIIKLKTNCDSISQLFRKGTLLPRGSASATIQLARLNMKPDLIDVVIDKMKVQQLIDQYVGRTKVNCGIELDVEKFFQQIILVLNKVKHAIFMKAGITTKGGLNLFDYLQTNELFYSEFLTNLVFRNNLPHISTYLTSYICDNKQVIDALNKTSQQNIALLLKEVFDKVVNKVNEEAYHADMEDVQNLMLPDKQIILLTENMNMDVTNKLSDLIGKRDGLVLFRRTVDEINRLIDIVIQLMYTLYIFRLSYFVHNDMHPGNIMIETLDEPFDFFYLIPIMNDEGIVQKHVAINFKSRFFVRVYDYDRSYQLGNSKYAFPDPEFDLRSTEIESHLQTDCKKIFGSMHAGIKPSPKELATVEPQNLIKFLEHISISGADPYKFLLSLAQGASTGFSVPIPADVLTRVSSAELPSLVVTPKSKIWFDQNQKISIIVDQIKTNESWIGLSVNEKITVAHPLVTSEDGSTLAGSFCKVFEPEEEEEEHEKDEDAVKDMRGGKTSYNKMLYTDTSSVQSSTSRKRYADTKRMYLKLMKMNR